MIVYEICQRNYDSYNRPFWDYTGDLFARKEDAEAEADRMNRSSWSSFANAFNTNLKLWGKQDAEELALIKAGLRPPRTQPFYHKFSPPTEVWYKVEEIEVREPKKNLADTYIETYFAHQRAEEDVLNFALKLFGASEDDIRSGSNWPFQDVVVDPSDWEGQSLELKGAIPGLSATLAQCNAAHAEGFDVIDISYGDGFKGYRRFFPDATLDRFWRVSNEFYMNERRGDDSGGWS